MNRCTGMDGRIILYFSLGRCHYTTALEFVVVLSNIYNKYAYKCDNLGLT